MFSKARLLLQKENIAWKACVALYQQLDIGLRQTITLFLNSSHHFFYSTEALTGVWLLCQANKWVNNANRLSWWTWCVSFCWIHIFIELKYLRIAWFCLDMLDLILLNCYFRQLSLNTGTLHVVMQTFVYLCRYSVNTIVSQSLRPVQMRILSSRVII